MIVGDGLSGGFLQRFGGTEVGVALGQVDSAMADGRTCHLADDGFGEIAGAKIGERSRADPGAARSGFCELLPGVAI